MSLFAFVSQPWNAAAAAVYPVRAPFPVGSSSSCCMESAANCPPLHFQRVPLIAPPPLPALHLFICIRVKRRGGSRVVLWAHKVKCWLPMLPSAASSDYCNYTNKSTPTLLWFIDAGMENSAACAVARLRQFGQLVRQLSDYSSGPSDVYTFVLWLFGSPKAFWSV